MATIANFSGKRFIDKAFLFYIRNIPEHRAKLRVVYFINDKLFKSAVNVINQNNNQLRVSTRDFIGNNLISFGSFEPLTINLCADILKDGGTFIDIGAYIGLFSIILSKIPNVLTIAVEPSPDNFIRLLEHIAINRQSNITAVNLGLSSRDSFGYLTKPLFNNASVVMVDENKTDNNSHLIRLTSLKNLVTHLNIKKITLIKMDIEGFEMNVLKGYFDDSTSIMPENIIMEFTEMVERTGYSEHDCYEFLISLGYKAYTVEGKEYTLNQTLPECNLWFKKQRSIENNRLYQ
jgi:FkbM family methyltransferase